MKKESQRIIGINPGTRYLGIAVLYGQELMDWRIKSFPGKWAKEKINKILEIIKKQIDLHNIDKIAIKRVHLSRSSRNLKLLVSNIIDFAKRRQIEVCRYSIKLLEKSFLSDEKLNKRNLIKIIVLKYPALFYEAEKEKLNKNSYHIRAIEAVALASACLFLEK